MGRSGRLDRPSKACDGAVGPSQSRNDPARRAFDWSAYWYRGHVYATNWLSQRPSFDVYAIDDPAIDDTYRLPHLNPQSQEAFAEAP